MRRVTIGQIALHSGLSRATVDRALNNRYGVHPRTKQVVEETLRQLSLAGVAPPGGAEPRNDADVDVDFVLRLGRGLMEQIKMASRVLGCRSARVHDMYQRDDGAILETVAEACRDAGRPLILTAKNSEPLRAELISARKRGKFIIAFISDLVPDARDAFVGIDNRMAGQTAAFILGSILKHRPAKAGVVLGDYAFSCHEDREIGFRSNLRANFPTVQVADVAKGEDSPQQTYEAVLDLLQRHPDLDAIYNVAGGNLGLARAVRAFASQKKIHILTHETNHITVPLIRDGLVDFAISQNPYDLLGKALELARRRTRSDSKELHLVDFAVYTKFNLPGYSIEPIGAHDDPAAARAPAARPAHGGDAREAAGR